MRSARFTVITTALILSLFFASSKTPFAQSQDDASGKSAVLRKEEAVAQLQASTAERLDLEVSFEEGVDAAELSKTLGASEVKVKSLLYKWGEHRAGYALKEDQTLDGALEAFGKSHVNFLERQINNLSVPSDQATPTTGSSEQADWERSRQKLLDEFSAQLKVFRENGFVLSGFVAEDIPDNLSRLLKSLPEKNLSFQIGAVSATAEEAPDSKAREQGRKAAPESDALTAAPAQVPYPNDPWKFTPSKGEIIYDAGKRVFTSYFYWGDVSGFRDPHIGYEHDIIVFTDKKGDFKFVSNDWRSNLPEYAPTSDGYPDGKRQYKDDTFGDDQSLFTIGTGAAAGIKAGERYYVEIPVYVANEKAGPTLGVVEAQLSSWAGKYDTGDIWVPETLEKLYCSTKGDGKNYSHCMFSDQHYTIYHYYNSTGIFRQFPFDYKVSAKFNWDKSSVNAPQLSCPQGQFRAEYRNVKSSSKNLIFARCEGPTLNHNWGKGNPGYGVEDDKFEVEWNGQFSFPQGMHRFIASSDDGIQVYVDGEPIINSWYNRSETEEQVERLMTAGVHTIRVRYYENKGDAAAKLRWEALGNCNAAVAADRWKGEYFNNLGLTGSPVMVRDDSDRNGGTFFAHDWGTGSPSANCGVSTDIFSARWTRRQYFDAGQYKFTLRADDGVRLYVDGILRLDRWFDQGPSNQSADVNLTAGQHDLRVEYYERKGGAVAQIYWERTGGGTVPPTISKYTWDATPKADQPFSGGVLGTGFVVSGTRVFFCVANTSNCYEHPSAGVTVSNSTNLRVTNVKLGRGSWQVYVQTAAGKSQPSEPFTVQAPPTNCVATVASDRWKGEYFNNLGLTGSPVMVRDDSSSSTSFFAHDWGAGSPNANCGVNSDDFSARWTRRQTFDAGRYRFTLRTDDGVRLYVDGTLRLDHWADQGPTNRSVDLDISAGQHDLRVEYYERKGGAGAQIYWERIAGIALPTVSGYTWASTPKAGQPFSGTVTGTGFVVGGTQLYFCVNGAANCYEHPQAGVKVSGATNLSVTNANLGAGSWQLYVKTSAGASGRSAAFTVQSPPQPPTIGGYSWSTSPAADRVFGGTVTGTGFVSGDTQLWFCVTGSNSCYRHPAAGVKVNSSTSLSVSNVSLGAGSWQFYVKTSAGQSGRSAAFNVAAPPARPTVTGYSWSSTPRADQSFGGTINGTGFVSGSTQVYFCLSGTNSCYQHPSSGVSVNSSTRLSVSNVRLDSGAWQFYVRTSAGQSDRSSSFAVFIGSPTISGFSWSTTPRAGQSFGGTISGSNFVPGGTQVRFCVAGTSTCYQHPSAGVTVDSLTRLRVSSVRLGAGSWQVYVQTYAGASSRSSAFSVR
jgi:hypothetical protein